MDLSKKDKKLYYEISGLQDCTTLQGLLDFVKTLCMEHGEDANINITIESYINGHDTCEHNILFQLKEAE